MQKTHDVFISHNLRDKPLVLSLKAQLDHRRYKTWLDNDHLQGGHSLIEQIRNGAKNCYSSIVCVGANAVGRFTENEELDILKSETELVIPVLMPGADADAKDLITRLFPEQLFIDLSKRGAGSYDPIELKKLRRSLGPPRIQTDDTLSDAPDLTESKHVPALARDVSAQGLTLFLGGTWSSRFDQPTPDDDELARFLAEEELADVLDDVGSLDEAAQMFALRHASDNVMLNLAMMAFIEPRATFPAPIYDEITALLHAINDKTQHSQHISRASVVVTTNIDIRLERALLFRGMPFTRLVLGGDAHPHRIHAYTHISGNQESGIEITGGPGHRGCRVQPTTDQDPSDPKIVSAFEFARDKHREYGAPDLLKLADYKYNIDLVRALSDPRFEYPVGSLRDFDFSQLPSPLIIKLRGASGMMKSLRFRQDQALRLPELVKELPPRIQDAIDSNPALYIGFSPSESLFALVDHAFRRDVGMDKQRDCIVVHAIGNEADKRDRIDRKFRPHFAESLRARNRLNLIWNEPAAVLEQLRHSIQQQAPVEDHISIFESGAGF